VAILFNVNYALALTLGSYKIAFESCFAAGVLVRIRVTRQKKKKG